MTEFLDHAHEEMEKALSRNRKHDMGKHGFFDTVEELVEESASAFGNEAEFNGPEARKTYHDEALLTRPLGSKTLTVFQLSVVVGAPPVLVTPGYPGTKRIVWTYITGTGQSFIGPSAANAMSYNGFCLTSLYEFEIHDYEGPLWISATGTGPMVSSFMIETYGSNS